MVGPKGMDLAQRPSLTYSPFSLSLSLSLCTFSFLQIIPPLQILSPTPTASPGHRPLPKKSAFHPASKNQTFLNLSTSSKDMLPLNLLACFLSCGTQVYWMTVFETLQNSP